MNNLTNLLLGILGSVIAAIIGYYYRKFIVEGKKLGKINRKIFELGHSFYINGLTKFHFSRDDYGRTLSTFIDDAQQSISIVSISLKITDDEGQLTRLFKRKLSANPLFTVTISLINPNNHELVKVTADTLNISKEKLSLEVTEMLNDLLDCHNSLDSSEKSRFNILVHDCFPMGSVVMLDATPKSGMIQVETKLYKSARAASFGFQLTRDSPFFEHNYGAWNRVIRDSKPILKEQLKR